MGGQTKENQVAHILVKKKEKKCKFMRLVLEENCIIYRGSMMSFPNMIIGNIVLVKFKAGFKMKRIMYNEI